ncbi:phage/plasmid primase, P4 family [Novosphingobium pituita]|uniref:SF3 helicase domain-containing protein n=1 Tax=Novosphingobium pituita TaxID=3056842 RepID=A0ABQ6PAX1_9SPHN|nr:phage/plasmid primase, P4 family [Novosphingobium sp. IK01]GMM62378.1 hypothetical protein NUTIK01_31550 [Novosphingobium sp. IK01]
MINALKIAQGLDRNYRASGSGYACKCPVHDDQTASLSVTDGKEGRVLVHCHAGCAPRDVIGELKARNLWPEAAPKHRPRSAGGYAEGANDNRKATAPKGQRGKLAKTYDYFDHWTGELKMQVLRYEPKGFSQRRPDPDHPGQWIKAVSAEHRTLYKAQSVAQANCVVLIVEGEKDVDNLTALGFVATCNPGGAGKWQDNYSEMLRDKTVVLLPDNDDAGRRHANVVAYKLSGIAASVRIVHLPDLPEKGDVSDWLAIEGNDRATLEKLIESSDDTPPASPASAASISVEDFLSREGRLTIFEAGSEVEVAQVLHSLLKRHLGTLVHAEGEFWHYRETRWQVLSRTELWRGVQHFDGAEVGNERPTLLKLGTKKIESILHELQMMCAVPDFFENPVMGINCASGFITFDADGQPSQRPHAPNDRARHTLPGCWAAGMSGGVPSGSLLDRLLTGSFAGDEDAADKINLLAEIAGVSALGYATELREPKAVILYGMTAENGKSQILDLMRGLLPPSAVSAITAAKMSDERYVVGLAGKLLNATDELSGAAIASDTFKTIITGEQVNGRDVYKSCIEFCPHAQHMFATNVLPPYKGGMDRGVQRRLLVVPFNHTVPKAERVEHIGKRIGAEEADLLLAWAVAGASRVIRNRAFSEPQSSKSALREWVCKADAVQAWIEIGIEAAPGHWVATSVAYEAFCNWAVSEGYMRDRLPNVSSFSERLQSTVAGVTDKRTSRKRGLVGLRIKPLF